VAATISKQSTTTKKAKPQSVYSAHPGIAYAQSVVANMKTKTGRSLEEWIAFVKKQGPVTEEEQRVWLKQKHKLGTNYAWWIAMRVHGKGEEDTDPRKYLVAAERYVEEMFAGKKATLRLIYDALLKLGLALGDDAKACPCQTMVPLYRENVFAQLKPTTNTRLDLGLCLRDAKGKLPARVIPTGGLEKGDRITHRIGIASVEEIDDEVKRWFKTAYESCAPKSK
jgi:hypothetical protein